LCGRVARGRVLDVFCYHGLFTLHMAPRAEHVLAVDSSADALAVAARNADFEDVANSPYVYSNVQVGESSGEKIRLSFDVSRHLDLDLAKSDPLVTEVLVQSLIQPASIGTKLKAIDTSLAARNDSIDTQLRGLIKPDEQPAEKGQPPPRHNNAPGAQVKVTGEAGKLQEARAANDKDALKRAFALLDPDQQEAARKLLDERGIVAPGAEKKPPMRSAADGVPLAP